MTPGQVPEPGARGRVRADAQRNIAALLTAAAEVFAETGVDAPVRQITARAGCGAGTLYRHFPQRSDLIAAVFRNEVDACAAAAREFAARSAPMDALTGWLHRYAQFVGTKRGLGAALHSGDPAYDGLPAYFQQAFEPALRQMLDTAAAAGCVPPATDPDDLLRAVANIAIPAAPDDPHTTRMIALLLDGLRYRAEGWNPAAPE